MCLDNRSFTTYSGVPPRPPLSLCARSIGVARSCPPLGIRYHGRFQLPTQMDRRPTRAGRPGDLSPLVVPFGEGLCLPGGSPLRRFETRVA